MSQSARVHRHRKKHQPNILILCVDQWQAQMELPKELSLPALERLEEEGVSLDHHYCTVPICTPSRSVMWTGRHAVHTGLIDNTNFAWGRAMSPSIPTIGHLLREQGYYTAFKGKWHVSIPPLGEDALEPYGFSDYQQWGDMYGAPLQGEQLDGAATFSTIDWLEHRGATMEAPWLLVSSLINPHDIMFLQTDPLERPHPNGTIAGLQSQAQRLGFFEKRWNVALPHNFDDDYQLQPPAVRAYKEGIDLNYGRIPDDREDLWLARRNYLINCMRLVDAHFMRVLETLDRLKLWDNTVVIFTGDHGEMNGAHRMTQKGAIHFDEAVVVNFTARIPGGPKGERSRAIGSQLDLAPTLLEFAGLDAREIAERYPELKGRSLMSALYDPRSHGPRGSVDSPGDGALFGWDGLNMLDHEWALTGALSELTELEVGPAPSPEEKRAALLEAGKKYGAPDFSKRNFYRAVVDGSYKLVRWFSPLEYGNPRTLDELLESGDITLHDLLSDPGELQNIGHRAHPDYQPALIERMLKKLHALVEREIGEDRPPFSLNLFGTREVKYRTPWRHEEPRRERPRA